MTSNVHRIDIFFTSNGIILNFTIKIIHDDNTEEYYTPALTSSEIIRIIQDYDNFNDFNTFIDFQNSISKQEQSTGISVIDEIKNIHMKLL